MKIHANARTTLKNRAILVDQVIRHQKTKAEAARAFGKTPTTVAKWVDRYQREGPKGLRDGSSAPISPGAV
jgi:transposase-like protein